MSENDSGNIATRARALLAAITRGPWAVVEDDADCWAIRTDRGCDFFFGEQGFDDAEFIAAAPQLVSDLVAECERLEAQLETAGRSHAKTLGLEAETYRLLQEERAAHAETRALLTRAYALLRWIKADRPSAHSDAVWDEIGAFLATDSPRAQEEGKTRAQG